MENGINIQERPDIRTDGPVGHSQKFLKKRKAMMELPIIIIPFLTIAFWAFGGGKGGERSVEQNGGLNTQLPDADLKDMRNADKLAFYNEADLDSAKRAEAIRIDPYYQGDTSVHGSSQFNLAGMDTSFAGYQTNTTMESNTKKVYQKLHELDRQINDPYAVSTYPIPPPDQMVNDPREFNEQVAKLETMMQMMSDKQEADPEMRDMDNTLDKILDIQHPQRVQEKIKKESLQKKTQVFAVDINKQKDVPTYFGAQKKDSLKKGTTNGFYDVADVAKDNDMPNSISAVVHETQTVTTGSTVKLRLGTDVYINGILIQMGSFVFGTASLDNERLGITINSVRWKENLLPVALSVFDIDGISGIHIPGSIDRDVVKQTGEQQMASLDVGTVDGAFGAQAAAAGIQAVKSLVGKKIKLVKVVLKAGYKVLLMDNNKQNN